MSDSSNSHKNKHDNYNLPQPLTFNQQSVSSDRQLEIFPKAFIKKRSPGESS